MQMCDAADKDFAVDPLARIVPVVSLLVQSGPVGSIWAGGRGGGRCAPSARVGMLLSE